MLVKSNPEEEQRKLDEILANDDEARRAHTLFVQEMELKKSLIAARKNKSMTQKDVSKLSGLSQQAVSRLETMRGGSLDTLLRYMNALDVSFIVKANENLK